ncbi:MAG: hypothetical protein E6Q97_37590 [Desulfurellales bacterium]|nr:MAG: hypothetical protein E6Q97_37590 [Desulfurellales bacterium]
MNNAFTYGPWGIEIGRDTLWVGPMRPHTELARQLGRTAKCDEIVASFEHGEDYTQEHNRVAMANARLVAAAPEMLAALEMTITEDDYANTIGGGLPGHVRAKIEQAIKKARGEQ